MTLRLFRFAVCLLVGLFAAAGARAEQIGSPGGLIGGIMQGLGLGPTVPPAADFVVRSRPDPDRLDYLPLRPTPPGFLENANLPLVRFEAEQDAIRGLEDARARNRAQATRVGAPDAPDRQEK